MLWKSSAARASLRQAVGDCVQFGLGSLHVNARFEAPDEIASSLASLHGYPKAGAKGVEARGHNPDKSPWSPAQNKTFPKNLRIAVEFFLPQPVVHHKYRRSTWTAIFLRERATEKRRDAQIVKRVRRYGRAVRQNAGGFAIIIEEPAHNPVGNHVFEDMILFA